jgi:hypothetical protein
MLNAMEKCTEVENIMGALAFTHGDKKGPYRIAVLGYTRKCVGDHLDWEAKST